MTRTTSASRQQRYRQRRRKGGDQRHSLWLDEATSASLRELATNYGSQEEAIKQVIAAHTGGVTDGND